MLAASHPSSTPSGGCDEEVGVTVGTVDVALQELRKTLQETFFGSEADPPYAITITPLLPSTPGDGGDPAAKDMPIALSATLDEVTFARRGLGMSAVDAASFAKSHKYTESKRTYHTPKSKPVGGGTSGSGLPKPKKKARRPTGRPTESRGHSGFDVWMVDSQERPCFGTSCKHARRYHELSQGQFTAQMTALLDILQDVAIPAAECSFTFSTGAWQRSKQFHLKCFVPPALYFTQFIKAVTTKSVRAMLLRDGKSPTSRAIYAARFATGCLSGKARTILESAAPVQLPLSKFGAVVPAAASAAGK
jgi:hypothetical protein